MQRKESSIPYFVQRIPKDVIEKAHGHKLAIPLGDKTVHKTVSAKSETVKLSLGTRDPSEAKIRQAGISSYLEGVWQSLRHGPSSLTHKQAVSLAGEVYKKFIAAVEDNPGSADMWQYTQERDAEALAGANRLMLDREGNTRRANLQYRFGGFVDHALNSRGLVVDQTSRSLLLEQVSLTVSEAAKTAGRYSEGDYSPDTYANRFPEFKEQTTTPNVSLTDLYTGWKKEAVTSGLSQSTFDAYYRSVRYLKAFLKHEDALRITVDDIINFKDYRLQQVNPKTGRKTSPRTVKDGDLAGLKSVFSWAVKNRKLPFNPAEGITVKVGKKIRTRPKYFRLAEASALLKAAKDHIPAAQEQIKTTYAKRWIPWICAYTGARVGEIAQLRKEDVREEEGVKIIRITPDAGDVKTKEYRDIPIHPHLIEEGFLEFVGLQQDGYLFLNAKPGDAVRGKRTTLKNRLGEFMRTIVTDPEVQPLHGWRHSFKAYGLEVEIEGRMLDRMQGHVPASTGDDYGGSGTLRAYEKAMSKFPRYIE